MRRVTGQESRRNGRAHRSHARIISRGWLLSGSGAILLPGLSTNDVTVTNAGGGDIQVSVAYNYQPMVGAILPDFGLVGGGIGLTFTLPATVRMRAL